MKFPPAVLLAASALLVGCGSLDNPFSGMNLFGTGRDARVYNAQTGEFEWPKDQQPRPPAGRSPATASRAPAPARKSDGRYFDATKNQWVDARDESTPRPKQKPRPSAVALLGTPAPSAPPPPPASSSATGVYNYSTGRIEWKPGAPIPARATPAPRQKSWWWPF